MVFGANSSVYESLMRRPLQHLSPLTWHGLNYPGTPSPPQLIHPVPHIYTLHPPSRVVRGFEPCHISHESFLLPSTLLGIKRFTRHYVCLSRVMCSSKDHDEKKKNGNNVRHPTAETFRKPPVPTSLTICPKAESSQLNGNYKGKGSENNSFSECPLLIVISAVVLLTSSLDVDL